MTRTMRMVLAMSLALPLLAVWPGCAVVRGALAPDFEPGPAFPAGAQRLETLDIQARRQGKTLVLTNTSARNFGPSRLWLNRWYSRRIESLKIGRTLRLPLVEFRDEHGAAMPGGGFFATVAPEPVVLAELQTEQGLAGLIVVQWATP